MKLLDDDREEGFDAVVDDKVEKLDGLLVVEFKLELAVNFADGFIRLQRDIRDICLQHQRKQIQNQIRVSAKMQISGVTMLLEGLEV